MALPCRSATSLLTFYSPSPERVTRSRWTEGANWGAFLCSSDSGETVSAPLLTASDHSQRTPAADTLLTVICMRAGPLNLTLSPDLKSIDSPSPSFRFRAAGCDLSASSVVWQTPKTRARRRPHSRSAEAARNPKFTLGSRAPPESTHSPALPLRGVWNKSLTG